MNERVHYPYYSYAKRSRPISLSSQAKADNSIRYLVDGSPIPSITTSCYYLRLHFHNRYKTCPEQCALSLYLNPSGLTGYAHRLVGTTNDTVVVGYTES